MIRVFLLVLLSVLSTATQGEDLFFLSQNVEKAREAIYAFQLDKADKYIQQEESERAYNLFLPYLKACKLTSKTLFYEGDDDSPYDSYYKEVKKHVQVLKSARVSSKYFYYCMGEMHFQLSMIYGRRHDNVKAASFARTALIYHKKNWLKYPDFYGSVKTLALMKETILSLPTAYQQSVRLIGMDVSNLPGRRELEKQINSAQIPATDSAYLKEASYYLAIMDYYLDAKAEKAWARVESVTRNYKHDHIAAFFRLNFALKCKKNDAALECINSGSQYWDLEKMPVMNILIGKARVYSIDTKAYPVLERYAKASKEAEVLAQLYMYYLDRIRGVSTAQKRLDRIIALPKGPGEQASAARELAINYKKGEPDVVLLRSRLLFDGGYYQKALDALGNKKERDYPNQAQKLEYNYRKGRIYEALGNDKLALLFYKEVLSKMGGSKQHYGSYAALHTAEIYERKKEYSKSKSAYSKTLQVCKSREYSKTVELKAKAGLKRVKAKV